MPKHTLIKRSAIAAALAFSLYAPTSHANYSQVIIFGDSLSDTGRLKDLVSEQDSTLGNALQPSFTTNPDPVWSSLFAQSYGKTANPNLPILLVRTMQLAELVLAQKWIGMALVCHPPEHKLSTI